MFGITGSSSTNPFLLAASQHGRRGVMANQITPDTTAPLGDTQRGGKSANFRKWNSITQDFESLAD